MKTITQIIIFILVIGSQSYLLGAHIIGGTISYRIFNIEAEKVEIRTSLHLYSEGEIPDPFDVNIKIGVYGFVNGDYQYLSTKEVELEYDSVIDFENIEECPDNTFDYKVGTYNFEIEIPKTGFEYYTISYQRCCRGPSISNIIDPITSGIAITLDIYPKAFEFLDQIAPLKTSFPAHVEPGFETLFDLSLEDIFEKEYYLTVPKAAGDNVIVAPNPANTPPEYAEVVYRHLTHPYGIGATVKLNKSSGLLEVNIPETGKTLMAVTLDRYADNQLVCRARQQFIINSLMCSPSSIENIHNANFSISPMPANQSIQFNIPLNHFSIYSIDGTKHVGIHNEKFITQIDINYLSEGIFFLKGQTKDGNWITKKLIKSK